MQTNVSQLLQEPIGSTRQVTISEAADITGDGNNYRVTGQCRLLRTKQGILTSCELDTETELTCSRCTSRFRQPLHLKFEEEFVPTVDIDSGVALESPGDPGDFTIDDHHILDITEAVRQYAVVSIPLKVLCKEDCAGLCQTCGANLNDGDCGCPRGGQDPRWSALSKLK